MKRIVFYLVLVLFAGLLTGCSLMGSSGKTHMKQYSSLKGFGITGLYANGNHIIAGTSSIGSTSYIFLSVDNGTSWQEVDSLHVDNTSPYTNLVLTTHTSFFGNGSTLFAGIGGGNNGKVLMSTDNGKSWTEADPGFTENVNCFTMINGTLYAGTNHGVFMTKNNGSNWASADTVSLSFPIEGITTVSGDLFAATSTKGIYRSINNGISWTKVNSTSFDFTDLVAVGTDLFVGASKFAGKDSTGGVFVSTNKGKSWSHADTGITDHDVYQLYSNGSDLFAGSNDGIYYSNNKGGNWVLIDSTGATSFATNNTYLYIGTANGIKRYLLSTLNK